ncbi:MAG: hypothetical protein MAG551_00607 [Candidatus Scalindua arabica]|uniref:Uncharacterized protein n=1 Tax=Candidatus Scalindua arabica TaxID=1127984 RepID=A0A941ZYM2_9BACT|nr:hypothetical protein [Candidatus Scalindua arabica]
MLKKLFEYFMITASICGLIAVIIATGIIAFNDKYFIIIIAPSCGFIAVVLSMGVITAVNKCVLSFGNGKLATTVNAASNHKISQDVQPHPDVEDAAAITVKKMPDEGWVSAAEAA